MVRSSTLPMLALLSLLAASASRLRDQAQALAPVRPELQLDIPAFPAEVSRPFSFGLRSLVADLTFLEAIQLNGGHKSSVRLADQRQDDRVLYRLLQYTVDLDPKFRGAYRFAGSALPRHTTDGYAAGIFAAEQLLRKGAVERPDDWQIPFLLGFIESFYLGKMQDAGEAMAQAARLPGAPRYVGLLATRLKADAGDVYTAERLAAVMEAQATEDATKQLWHERMLDLRVERELQQIEAAAARYKARTGAPAPSVEALVSARELPAMPEEPRGGHYLLAPSGEAHSTATPRLRVRGRAGTQSGLIAQ